MGSKVKLSNAKRDWWLHGRLSISTTHSPNGSSISLRSVNEYCVKHYGFLLVSFRRKIPLPRTPLLINLVYRQQDQDHWIQCQLLTLLGLQWQVYKWQPTSGHFSCYVTTATCNKTFYCLSSLTAFICGLPQGSVLSPLLFLLYSSPVLSLMSSFNHHNHAFTDILHQLT